jgi:hypothetical protein
LKRRKWRWIGSFPDRPHHIKYSSCFSNSNFNVLIWSPKIVYFATKVSTGVYFFQILAIYCQICSCFCVWL